MKKNRGITMIALVVTIALLMIIIGISLKSGSDIIEKSNLENLKTNMLLIKGKTKEYVENANFKLGTISSIDSLNDEDKSKRISTAKGELKGEEITNSSIFEGNISIDQTQLDSDRAMYIYYYKLSTENLVDIGITNVKSNNDTGWYIIKYDINNANVEVYNTRGFENEGITQYSLTEIQNIEL